MTLKWYFGSFDHALGRTEHCVQLHINMQVQQRAGLWTQLTAPWLEERGELAVHGLKRLNGLSVTQRHIHSHGLLVRALAFYWAGTETG